MKKTNSLEEQYRAARAEREAAEAELQRVERADVDNMQSYTAAAAKSSPFRQRLKIRVLEAKILEAESVTALNASAPDSEALRSLLLAELAQARDVIANTPDPVPPAALASASPEAVVAHAEAVVAYAEATCGKQVKLAAALTRINAVLESAFAAQQLIYSQRTAAKLPSPTRLFPEKLAGGPGNFDAITSAADCDRFVAFIEAQRTPAPANTGAWRYELDRERAQLEKLEAEDAIARAARDHRENWLV